MSHQAYKEGSIFQAEADYIVVGSGPGGAAIAVDLARNGEKVLIVEAGPWRDPKDYPFTGYGIMRDMFLNWGLGITKGNVMWPIVQGSVVGGSSVINSAICVRTPENIFEEWKSNHSLNDPQLRDRIWNYQDQLENELHVAPTAHESLGKNNTLPLKGAEKLGIDSHVINRFAKGCIGTGNCLQGCKEERKQSLNLQYVPEVIARGGQVVSCAPVNKVLFEKNRAVGVEGHFRHPQKRHQGAPFELRAKKGVIISASATQSPTILNRSGVKLPALGSNFRAHPGSQMVGLYDDKVDMNTGTTQGWASLEYKDTASRMKIESLAVPLELAFGRMPGGGNKLMEIVSQYRNMATTVFAVRTDAVGKVSKNFSGNASVSYSLTKQDVVRFRDGFYNTAKIHFASGAKAVLPGVHGLPLSIEEKDLDLLKNAPAKLNNFVGALSHLFGGCVMGTDIKNSVCDFNGKVHSYENLYVADASNLPTSLGVNPQHTIMAVSKDIAFKILDQSEHQGQSKVFVRQNVSA